MLLYKWSDFLGGPMWSQEFDSMIFFVGLFCLGIFYECIILLEFGQVTSSLLGCPA